MNWESKLRAYLHDPPEKALDLAWHKARAEAHQSGLGLAETEFNHSADHTAAAADRLPWPTYHHLECAFDGSENHFRHPLGKAVLKITPFSTADIATDKAWRSRPLLAGDPGDSGFDHRAQFLAYWRLWRWWASDQRLPRDPRLAFLPADTRMPDHTIWAHNSLVSALQGCVEDGVCRPAFLLFQLGPVQEYIAQARRTLDLWSGSYLLSYLMGCGLRHIALNSELGPDHVIFPNLCGQPIFDLLLKDEVWAKASVREETDDSKASTLWDSLGYDSDYARLRLLTPSLPNRFLAIVPAGRATEIAKEVEKVVRTSHENIAKAVWKLASQKLGTRVANQETRFFAQSSRFLDLSWQTLPWPKLPSEAKTLTAQIPSPKDADFQAGLQSILDLASQMPRDHRDVRNFKCDEFPAGTRSPGGHNIGGWKDKSKLEDDAQLDNPGAAWSAVYALLNWQLDAVRQTRAWKAWNVGGWSTGIEHNKDSLNGREEAILNLGSDAVPESDVKGLNDAFGVEHLFKKGELLGASTLIKRLWPNAWLLDPKNHRNHGHEPLFKSGDFSMPDTRDIADGRPFDMSGDTDKQGDDERKSYFAVLAFDGDEMGKWVSGTHPNMPKLGDQLADYKKAGERKGARVYFEQNAALKALLDKPRPLNPSFHLQLSEMLGTFSNVCARRVVEAFDGRLIFSGGDDVLALVPADRALDCARSLRAAFRGEQSLNAVQGAWMVSKGKGFAEKDFGLTLFEVAHEGFVQLHKNNYLIMAGEPKGFPAIVPGPAADCSVGIAIAHFKSPLQDVVRAAQAAERRAKKELGRSAVAVSLFKRSGEITEWGCQWNSGGLEIYDAVLQAIAKRAVSNKFPHRVVELLDGYLTETSPLAAKSLEPLPDFKTVEIAMLEFRHALDRQGQAKRTPEYAALERLAADADDSPASPSIRRYLEHVCQRAAIALAGKLGQRIEERYAKQTRADHVVKGLLKLGEAKVESGSDRETELRKLLSEAGSLPDLPDADTKWLKHELESAGKQLDRQRIESPLSALIGLCQTVAFIERNLPEIETADLAHRTRNGSESNSQTTGRDGARRSEPLGNRTEPVQNPPSKDTV
jgi:hypothetical protein